MKSSRRGLQVVIDARWVFPQISGIGSYTTELVRHLARLEGEERFTLLFQHDEVARRVMTGLGNSTRAVPVRYSPFSWRSQVFLPGLLRRLKADVYHAPNYLVPYPAFPRRRSGKIRCAVTIHDLIPLLFPQMTPRALKTRLHPLFRQVLRETVRRADAVITPSEATSADVARCLDCFKFAGTAPVVVPEGVDRRYRPDAGVRRRPAEILYVGRLDPYKNVPLLVEALAALRRKHPAARLRIIGPRDPRYPEASRIARQLDVEEAVDWEGYVDSRELVRAYQRAAVFVLPSSYEGFGLPVLEAMACGTPVICSRASSLPEVAGDAALLVPPEDGGALTEALDRVLSEPALSASLACKGLEQAARFSWLKTAERTREVYRQLGGAADDC